jgi:putative SOS response-associated peptidase YedK
MCYYTEIRFTNQEVLDTFGVINDVTSEDYDWPDSEVTINGFGHPRMPILLDQKPGLLVTDYSWGLLPEGRKPEFRKNTLNARIETIEQKPSFSNYVSNRCCVLVSSYVDWHWEDPTGKKKTKYHIYSAEGEIFALAGIHTSWHDGQKQWNTFAICTTTPNDTMKYIHNRKAAEGDERMPIMLRRGDESAWMDSKNAAMDFSYPNYKAELVAF